MMEVHHHHHHHFHVHYSPKEEDLFKDSSPFIGAFVNDQGQQKLVIYKHISSSSSTKTLLPVHHNAIDPSKLSIPSSIKAVEQKAEENFKPKKKNEGFATSVGPPILITKKDENNQNQNITQNNNNHTVVHTTSNNNNSKTACYEIDISAIASDREHRTSVMVRNIPNKYTQKMLLQEINRKFRRKYDFFYLPVDFRSKCNMGYAFINFLHPRTVLEFYHEFNQKKWERFNSEKICSVTYGRLQGWTTLVAHFNTATVMKQDRKVRPLFRKPPTNAIFIDQDASFIFNNPDNNNSMAAVDHDDFASCSETDGISAPWNIWTVAAAVPRKEPDENPQICLNSYNNNNAMNPTAQQLHPSNSYGSFHNNNNSPNNNNNMPSSSSTSTLINNANIPPNGQQGQILHTSSSAQTFHNFHHQYHPTTTMQPINNNNNASPPQNLVSSNSLVFSNNPYNNNSSNAGYIGENRGGGGGLRRNIVSAANIAHLHHQTTQQTNSPRNNNNNTYMASHYPSQNSAPQELLLYGSKQHGFSSGSLFMMDEQQQQLEMEKQEPVYFSSENNNNNNNNGDLFMDAWPNFETSLLGFPSSAVIEGLLENADEMKEK